MTRTLAVLVAIAALLPAPLLAHAVVDLALRSNMPEFVPRGETTKVEIIVDALAFDPAYGVVVTIDSASDSQFSAVSANSAWRCERQSKRIRCSAEELVTGPHAIEIDLAVPATETSIRLTALAESLGSFDPVDGNNAIASTSRTYRRNDCGQSSPVISGGPALEWTAAPNATSYEVLAGIDGERLRAIAVTSETTANPKFAGGDVTWMVRARFADCPSVVSTSATFRSNGPAARLAVVSAAQSSMQRPVAAVADVDGILVADPGNRAFFSYDVSRNVLAPLPIFGDIVAFPPSADGGMAIGPGGFIYFVDRSNHVVRFGYPPPRYVYFVAGNPRTPGFADGKSTAARFSSPTAVAVNERAVIFVSDSGNHAIRRIAWDASAFDFMTSTIAGTNLSDPAGIAIDGDGNLIVADRANHTVHRITEGGEVTTIASELNQPFGIAVDDRGNIYVSELGSGDIKKIAPNGRVTTVATGLNRPGLLAVGSDGSLWIPEEGTGRLLRGVMTTGERRRAVKQ